MGRPKGEGARSKTRPSSSSLAASLLPAGTATVGFGGYVGSSRLESSLPGDDAFPFSDVDSEIAQHLKRLGRKDPITKLKALTSLADLFKQKSGEDIVQIIPQWAFEYKRLLQDYNREVRRATNDTMTNFVITVGRGLAPHLKSLMGPWWFSQFDPVPEVYQSARRSLQAAFPAQEKRLDALSLCANEILLYIEENLKLTPQAISDKVAPLDELEDIHQRVISSSLLALATLLDILLGMQVQRPGFENVIAEPKNASKARTTVISSAEKMFSTHKYFLEFLKSQSPGVRSATYSVLGSFIKHVPHVFNEGNMKTLSVNILGAFQEKDPACHSSMWETILLFSKSFPDSWTLPNVQKTAVNRFWHFLKNGCYGSRQASYPVLIVLLDTIVVKAVHGEQFLLSFFQYLWDGRNPFNPSTADRLAFFNAFKECFIWAVHNASRFCNGVDAISHFQIGLVQNILVTLLWHDYLLVVHPKGHGGVSYGNSICSFENNTQAFQETKMDPVTIKYPMGYLQDLGKCIIGILSEFSSKECDLLDPFSASFQEDILEILRQEHLQKLSEHVEQVVNFLILLDEYAVQKGERWPLVYLSRPMVANSFPLIRSMDSPDAVKLLSITVSIFGPQEVVSKLSIGGQRHQSSDISIGGDKKSKSENFLQSFKEIFVPWCLYGNNRSTSARLDLLLALLDGEHFSEQWPSIIKYAILEHPGTELLLDFDRIDMLAMLMEKVRGEINKKKAVPELGHWHGSYLELWQHKLLDSTAVSIACCSPSLWISHARFLGSVLGGSTEDDQSYFVSRDAIFLIYEEILKKFILFLMESPFKWAKDACSLIECIMEKDLMPKCESYVNILEMAQFAFEVLKGSFFCLKIFSEEHKLLTCISTVLFIIDWEHSMASEVAIDGSSMTSGCILDAESQKRLDSKFSFGESMHAFRCKISPNFWKGFNMCNLKKLTSILIQTIRDAIFKTDTFYTDKVISLCCQWMLEILDILCWDNCSEQTLLDQLFDKRDFWPLWVAPALDNDSRSAILKAKSILTDAHESRHQQFVAFTDKLISKLGVGRVLAVSQTVPSSSEEATNELVTSKSSFPRAWLAAEILCTWKWPGGSALSSFLPLLREHAKNRNSPAEDSLLDSIINILLDGSLVHGTSCQVGLFNVWPASDDEVEIIKEPFLRALISLLSVLIIKDVIWGKAKVVVLFEFLVNKLFIGETVNRNCLRILPFVMNVLIQPLRHKGSGSDGSSENAQIDSFKESDVHYIIKEWLQRALSLPPLVSWESGQDIEEWIQLIISCYPLSAIGEIGALKIAQKREISHLEKKLLLVLFRKQRTDSNASTAVSQFPAAQMTLSKLMAVSVGYCWKEFDENDWEFLLSQLQGWTESAVLLMEEIAENVDNIVVNMPTSGDMEVTIKELEEAVQILDPFPLTIARTALFSFSLFCGFSDLHAEDTKILNTLKLERFDPIRDRIVEAILRLFFATGIAEAISRSCCLEAASIVASTRLAHSHLWDLVASSVINSSYHARNSAVKSVELWGLSKGSISSLYAILFSSEPTSSLQFAAFTILTTEPVSHMAFTKEDTARYFNEDIDDSEPNQSQVGSSSAEEAFHFREEISCMIGKSPYNLLKMDLLAQDRVSVFVAWALLLSHLQSLPLSSPAREKLVQCLQDFADSIILECLFQHIPWKSGMLPNSKKDVELPAGISEAANAATRAITTGSLLFSVESLWPVGTKQMASLAGAVYGLMLCVLPAYVRGCFAGIRDRSTSSAIESFTKIWCSPSLIADELHQIKKADVADENFSVSVNKSSCEVIATYKKEETGMDLVIHLPASYPLRPVDVDCTRSLGISEVKKRKWLMSMMAFVRNQNGALAEAIRIWKSNFDKEFQGVEECPICYSIIHTSNHSLPRLACKTCKHKFHSACLYKWFSTSHKSTCPLCQSPF
ncbi:PREDICTED: E3 ubiquitin-protein ligase listerin [Nelumbo nucifera]|uniref:E3 ubiquitin-protein ligase listerin n=1 Tax=Nelumbo nucifera TaxID=4432 RepID=A0A1U8A598_NELNU|nr:PREDICTED: E3 ubiquitin-protein ligase listerin [Nelumbo nucifera]